MGMVWEASQKGVPFLGVPGNSLKGYPYFWKHPYIYMICEMEGVDQVGEDIWI